MTATNSTGSGRQGLWPIRCASAASLIAALCGIAIAQSPAKEQPAAEEQIPAAQAPEALPTSTDPAELRRLAKDFRYISQSNAAHRAMGERERQALMAMIAKGDPLPLEARLIPQSETTADLRHENALHFQALSDSFAQEAGLREKAQELRGESESLAKAGEADKAKQLAEQAERELANAEVAAAARNERERLFARTKDFRDGLQVLEDDAAALRNGGKHPEAAAVDLKIRQHLKNPLMLEGMVYGGRAEEPIVFRYVLQNARAADVLATLRQLGNTLQDWIAEERTNTIFARGPRAEIYRLSESIDELDQPVKDTGGETQTTTRQVPTVLGAAVQAIQPHDTQRSDGAHIRVYNVRHVRTEEACDLIANNWGLSPTVVSGRIVVAATPQDHEGIAAVLAKLDVPVLAAVDPAPVNPGEQPLPNPSGEAIDEQHIEDSLPKLRAAYATAEQLAQNLKAKFKPSAKPIPADNPLRIQLRAAVAKSFEARQALLKAELIEFQQRISRIGQSIELRSRIADQIIDRRVEELLNSSLNWDTTTPSSPTIGESVTPDELRPIPAGPIQGDPIPESAGGETNDGAEDLAQLQGVWSITKAYGPFERGIAALDRKGTFRFEQDMVRIVWEVVQQLTPRREEAAARVILRPGSPAGQLDIVWTNPDVELKLQCLYGWDHDKLILALPYDGKDVSALLPRPAELRPARQTLYLELERVREDPPPSTGEVRRLPPLSLLVTHKGEPVENAIVDIFRQAYQPDAVRPEVERLGMTKTDVNGRCQVPLGRAIWKQEPRSAYVVYVSAPDRTVRSLLINSDMGDGSIIRVDKDARRAWINLGASDHVQPGMTFSIYGKDGSEAAGTTSEVKGKIEVVAVLESHLAEARPIEEDLVDAIAPGDTIYAPLWTPGPPDQYAVVGKLDLDNDGDSDRELFHKAMAMRGAKLADEVDDDGNRTGEGIDASIKFLILGQVPDISKITNVTDRANARKTLRHLDEMRNEARSHSVRVIPLADFLVSINYRLSRELPKPIEAPPIFPVPVSVEFDGNRPPTPYVPPLHLVVGSRKGVTVVPGRDKVQGFLIQEGSAVEDSTIPPDEIDPEDPRPKADATPTTSGAAEQSSRNLFAILKALHHYHYEGRAGRLPPAVVLGKDGKGTVPHSWRVAILPYLGYPNTVRRVSLRRALG